MVDELHFYLLNGKLDVNITPYETETHEKYSGKRIYTKYIDCLSLPNAATKAFNLNLPNGVCWVDESNSYIYSDVQAYKDTIFPLTYHNLLTGSGITYSLNKTTKQITFISKDNWSAYNAFITVKYYKY